MRNVQPLGDCKDLGGGRWSCRLQAEYRDRLMSAIGRADWQVFEGDFEFLQEGDTWRAVSYTHLDGYKRQRWHRAAAARCRSGPASGTASRIRQMCIRDSSSSAQMQPISVPIRRQPLRWRVSAKPGFMMMTMVSMIQ